MSCKYCDGTPGIVKGTPAMILDEDGILASLSGNPGRWAHANLDGHWGCEDPPSPDPDPLPYKFLAELVAEGKARIHEDCEDEDGGVFVDGVCLWCGGKEPRYVNSPFSYSKIHPNSVEAYYGIDRESRKGIIFRLLLEIARPLTDWQILKRLFPDSGDPNLVRPRITEMIKDPNIPLESLFSVRSFRTGEWNRMVEFVPRLGQQALPFGAMNDKA